MHGVPDMEQLARACDLAASISTERSRGLMNLDFAVDFVLGLGVYCGFLVMRILKSGHISVLQHTKCSGTAGRSICVVCMYVRMYVCVARLCVEVTYQQSTRSHNVKLK